jgi:FtsP/CotA-like multicopper oxidase with cupredoxin domain
MNRYEFLSMSRRELMKYGGMALVGSAAFRSRPSWAQGGTGTCQVEPPQPHPIEPGFGIGVGAEAFPTSPFINEPFTDPLPCAPGNGPAGSNALLTAMKPGWRRPDGTLDPSNPQAWSVRASQFGAGVVGPSSDEGHQDGYGHRPVYNTFTRQVPYAGTHQVWPGSGLLAGLPQPILYHIRLQVNQHAFTTSSVRPIGTTSGPTATSTGSAFDVVPPNVPLINGRYHMPPSTIYGFNGTFPGPLINSEYGRPVCVRFENDLDLNPLNLDRGDFGAPDWAFLTHLHNGHTPPESDGQPHHLQDEDGGYIPQMWCDNLYPMYPAGGDPNEKQSFLWFHDHRMHHTGANVYKGMVGLMPHYDPILDPGDETARLKGKGALGLPGRRVDNGDGTFDVKYDIPLALYDVALDDGTTPHQDYHNGCGELHPEWWGKSFFRHYPNHGFVGDIFTVNGVAYPVLHVYRRKYRLRFLGASIARDYDLWLMRGTPRPEPGTQGQWQLPDGQQCMRFTQIASEGGLLPRPIIRDHFEIWPAKRREVIVDFTRYMDNSPTCAGGVAEAIYLVDTLQMPNGRKPKFAFDTFVDPTEPALAFDPNYRVPMMKIVIHPDPLPEPDVSVIPNALRTMPTLPKTLKGLPERTFELQRGGTAGGETQWLINGLQFNPLLPLAEPKQGAGELWTVTNGGGGWTHPMHMHMEEHHVLTRNGVNAPDKRHPDDTGKEDVVALDPGETVTFFRRFRSYKGNYVAHCHNLAHEDHNMMFGWSIV